MKSLEPGGQSTGPSAIATNPECAIRETTQSPILSSTMPIESPGVRTDADKDQHRKSTAGASDRTSVRRTSFDALLK
jgi:hypothetical protein